MSLRFAAVFAVSFGISTSSIALALEKIEPKDWLKAPDVVEFQPFAKGSEVFDVGNHKVQLISLNTYANAWFLLSVQTANRPSRVYNLENPFPMDQGLDLNPDGTLKLRSKGGVVTSCDVINSGSLVAALGKDPYMSLCEGRVYLRNMATGRKDSISLVATALRDVLGEEGDKAVNAVKTTIFDGQFFVGGTEAQATSTTAVEEGGPEAAKVNNDKAILNNHQLGIATKDSLPDGMGVGQWYQAKNHDGLFVSVMKAKYVDDKIMKSFPERVNGMNSHGAGESEAVVNSMAIDLSMFKFGWNSGTEHPGVGWSIRSKDAQKSGGPDGFNSLNPLAFPGVVNPVQASQAVAVLTGGFQRMHSAFKYGPLSEINLGSHYGYMEKGVVMSTLVPNLATVIIYHDGSLEMKTWTLADNKNLSKIRDARQNGVALIENGEPTVYAGNWGNGNWSGSAASELKTPRAAFCMVQRGAKKFLVVSYFSTHTPNGIARVFQSYGCKYAVHMDMNSPKFAYSAFFKSDGNSFQIEHLNQGMNEDVTVNRVKAPRSLLTPTYKDFFYVLKK